MTVGEQIAAGMARQGLCVIGLARGLGVSCQSVRHWLAGKSLPGKRHVPDLERILGCPLDFSHPLPLAVTVPGSGLSDLSRFLALSPKQRTELLRWADLVGLEWQT
jgi:hypothetical protein